MRRWKRWVKVSLGISLWALGACGTTANSTDLDSTGGTDDAQVGDAAPGDAAADGLIGDTIGADGVVDVPDVIGADLVGADAVPDVADTVDVAPDVTDDVPLDAAIWDVPGPDVGPDVPAPTCADFTQPPATSPTSITLVNQTTGNLYLGQPTPTCAFDLGYTLTSPSGADLLATLNPCQFTCGQVQGQGCGCPPVACQPNIVTLVAPGKSFNFGWPGTIFQPAAMPTSCYQESTCASSGCFVETTATPDTSIHITAYTAALCDGAPCADCTPGATGNCTIFGATGTGGTAKPVSAVWGAQSQVQLIVK